MNEPAPTIAGARYRLVETLGRGGMSQVWRAWDERLAVWRAVKILSPRGGDAVALRARFEAEARAMARVRHPHVLAVHDVGSDGGVHWIVMDLAEGGSLSERIRRTELPARQVCGLVCSVLDALGSAHAQGIVHRDVKPSNLMLDASGTPLVADFGIARLTDEDTSLTRTGAGVGTQGYMAPEQRSGARGIDGRADVYGAGATLFALLTGETPYDLHTEEARREQLRDVPGPLADVIARATRWDPADRFPTAGAMRAALSAVAATLPDETPVPLDVRATTGPAPPPRLAPVDSTGLTWHDEPAPTAEPAPAWTRWIAPVALPAAAAVLVGVVLATRPAPEVGRIAPAGDVFRVTREPVGSPVEAVAVSPDGQRLAWSTHRGVFATGVRGGAVEQLHTTPARSLAWPVSGLLVDTQAGIQRLVDGELREAVHGGGIVAAHRETVAWIWKSAVWVREGAGAPRVLVVPGEPRALAFSPDGAALAVATNQEASELHAVEILAVPVDGSAPTVVASDTALLQSNLHGVVAWPEPDAVWAARTDRGDLGPRAEIWRYPLSGTPTRLGALPAASVTGLAHGPGVLALILDSSQTDLVRVRDGATERLTLDDGNDRDGAVLPDGRLLWVTDRAGNFDVLTGIPGQEPEVFAGTPAHEAYPVPVPGGVLYWRSPVGGERAELVRRAHDGAERVLLDQPITRTDRNFGRPPPVAAKVCCAALTGACVLGRVEGERMVFRPIDPDSGALGAAAVSGAGAVYTRWVVGDGEVLYADPERRGLFRLDLATGREQPIRVERPGRPHDLALAPDGGLWWTTNADPWELRHLAADGTSRVLARHPGRLVQVFAGPDGLPIVTLGSEDSDVWALAITDGE